MQYVTVLLGIWSIFVSDIAAVGENATVVSELLNDIALENNLTASDDIGSNVSSLVVDVAMKTDPAVAAILSDSTATGVAVPGKVGSRFFRPPIYRPHCYEEESNTRCSLDELRIGSKSSMYVVPDLNTGAKCIDGSEYKYQVFPGDTDKLLVYFQGGGGCWTVMTTTIGTCRPTAGHPANRTGIFDRFNPKNPYKDYTILQILYCSGCLHVGNSERPYTRAFSDKKIEQRGSINTDTALKWMERQNFQLDKLVISGSSAGSLATQFYAGHLLRTVKYRSATVLMDSFSNVAPAVESTLFLNMGLCTNTRIFDGKPTLLSKCKAGTLTSNEIFRDTISSFPQVSFVSISSKQDIIQLKFYAALSGKYNKLFSMSSLTLYNMLVDRYESYLPFHNHLTYFIDTPAHIFLDNPRFYNTYTNGIIGHPKNPNTIGRGLSLSEFVSQFPVPHGKTVTSQCNGRPTRKRPLQLNQCSFQLSSSYYIGPKPSFPTWHLETLFHLHHFTKTLHQKATNLLPFK